MIRELLTTGMGGVLLAFAAPAHATAERVDRQVEHRPVAPRVMLPGDQFNPVGGRKAAPPKRNPSTQSGQGATLPHPFREQVAQPGARA